MIDSAASNSITSSTKTSKKPSNPYLDSGEALILTSTSLVMMIEINTKNSKLANGMLIFSAYTVDMMPIPLF